ncbi:hypothetical protein HDU98_001424 [Podochytrium sp. JEL0797]|nr:hypothetical protein HDU98_001424 [Podochytrium sp. JEL0797]
MATDTPPPAHPQPKSDGSTAMRAATKFEEASEKALEVLEGRWKTHNRTLLSSFAFGVLLAADGSIRALRSPTTRKHLINVTTTLAIVILVFYILAQIATLPVRILKYLVWGVSWMATADDNNPSLQFFDTIVKYFYMAFYGLLVMVPMAGLYCVRYYYPGPMDKIFKESLTMFMSEIENPNFRLQAKNASKSLDASFDQTHSSKAWYANLQAFGARYGSRFKILCLVFLLSFVPVVGFLAWPSATFLYIGDKVNYPTAAGLFVLTFISPRLSRHIRGPLMRAVFELRALARELVDPYVSRSKMTADQKHAWLKKNDAVIIGFTVPFFVLLWVPLIGPALFFALANSCAARLCLEIFDKVDFDDGQERKVFEPRLGFLKKGVSEKVLVLAASADVLLEAGMGMMFQVSDQVLKDAVAKARGFLASAAREKME